MHITRRFISTPSKPKPLPRQTKSNTGLPELVTLQANGKEFHFELQSTLVPFGNDCSVQNAWIKNASLRQPKQKICGSKQSIIEFTRAMAIERGLERDIQALTTYVLAHCFEHLSNKKGNQRTYKDAFLRPTFSEFNKWNGEGDYSCSRMSPDSLSLDECQRARNAANSRDFFSVRSELDRTLGIFEPEKKLLRLFQLSMANLVGSCIVAFKSSGNDGLFDKINTELIPLLNRYIKKGGNLCLRNFVYFFSYECKLAYYSCYSNCWSNLIPRLVESGGLSEVSARFLSFWHNQGRSIRIPPGYTWNSYLAGQHKYDAGYWNHLFIPGGPTVERDVFNGQILSLHPISNYLLHDDYFRYTIVDFFRDDVAYTKALKQGHHELCTKYWKMIESILMAATQYRKDMDKQRQRTTSFPLLSWDPLKSISLEFDENDTGIKLDDFLVSFVESRNTRTKCCNGALSYQFLGEPADSATISLYCKCQECGLIIPREFQFKNLLYS